MSNGCYSKSFSRTKEFKDLATAANLDTHSLEHIIKEWRKGDQSRDDKVPSLEEVKSFYDRTFVTDDRSLKPFYREYKKGDTLFGDTFKEDKKALVALYGGKNVFDYTLADGTRVLKSAVPISKTAAKKLERKEAPKKEKVKLSKPTAADKNILFNVTHNPFVSLSFEDKPWKDDPTKKNRSVRVYLEGQEEKGYFELVKDMEDRNYSVHFKPTDSSNPNAFSEQEKQILFQAVANLVPNGGRLSTWGTISRGGIAGIERFKSLGFIDTGEVRTLTREDNGNEVAIPILEKAVGLPGGNSMSEKIDRDLASKTSVQKPEGNFKPTTTVSYTDRENLGSTSQTVQLGVEDGAQIDSISETVRGDVVNGKVAVNTRIVPDVSSVDKLVSSIKALNRLGSVFVKKGEKTIELEASNLSSEDLAKLKKLDITPDSEGKVYIPTYTVGHTDYELDLKIQREKLRTQGNFSEIELREYAKRAVYKLSDTITRLQNGEAKTIFGKGKEYQQYLVDAQGNDIDYTKMSRIDIIRRIGLTNMMNMFVKDVFFRPSQFNALGHNMRLIRKASVIANNWNAFTELAYDTLANIEEVALTDARGKALSFSMEDSMETGAEGESLDATTEAEIAELYGNTVEHWQVGFRQISAFNSLSQAIRNTLGQLSVLDKDGNIVKDQFGLNQNVNTADAVTKILSWTQHVTSLQDMIDKLRKHIDTDPWLRQLVGENDTAYKNDDGVTTNGVLVNPEFGQLQSQFFSNFKKYFQEYSVTYVDHKGNVNIRAVNSQPFETETVDDISTLLQNGKLAIWDDINHKTTNEYALLDRILGKPLRGGRRGEPVIPASGLHKYVEKIHNGTFTDADRVRVIENIKKAYEFLNIPVPSDSQMQLLFTNDVIEEFTTALGYLMGDIDTAIELANHNEGRFVLFGKRGELLKNGIRRRDGSEGYQDAVNATSNYKKLVSFIAPAMAASKEVVSYEGGKLYYAYVTPGYLGLHIDKLKGYLKSGQTYEQFMQDEYLRYEGFFYNTRGRQYGPEGHLNYWISRLMDETDGADVRKKLEHVTSLTYQGTAYADKTSAQYYASLISMFLYDAHGRSAYYRVPTLSNKPSEEYIKFERLGSNYKRIVIDWLAEKTFYQELNRIRAVEERQKYLGNNPEAIIKNFDKNGLEFSFLPFLNDALHDMNDPFGAMLRKMIDGETLDPDSNEGVQFFNSLKTAIEQGINEQFNDFLDKAERAEFFTRSKETGEIESVFQVEDLLSKDKSIESTLEEYFWNDYFASINILQLTITDIAMYKDTEYLQKRLAQLHSPGMRPNIEALDIVTHERVSDDMERYIIIKDSTVQSDIVTNLKVAYNRMLQNPRYKTAKGYTRLGEAMIAKYKHLIDVFSNPKAINWADAQAYSSPTSYRKKMHWFGKWDMNQEKAYQKVISGDFTDEDLDVVWQPLKPFVYSQIPKSSGVDSMPLIKMGIQNKNSEYLLLMADALMRAAGVDSKLGAIYDVMERSQGEWVTGEDGKRKFVQNGKGIDTVMFESAVKAGLTGIIDLNNLSADEIRSKLWDGEAILKGNDGVLYNETFVHEVPGEHYTIQQEVPAHFKGEQQMGSQARIHVIADLPDVGPDGKANTIRVKREKVSPNGKVQIVEEEMTVADLKAEYQKLIADNINDSVKDLIEEMGLNIANKKLRNIALSKRLKEEILKDGRFGSDMLWACDTDINGEFNIPLSDPIQSGRIQQLLNSIIKNRINKQEVAGGAVVQVSSWGVKQNRELGIRFKSRDGKLLYTRKEFEAKQSGEENSKYVSKEGYTSYEDYVKKNQYSVAYFEAFAPIYDDRLMKFADKNGNINIKWIERENPELLEMIGYRIPTEAKYSMVPIKIVGFLPRNSGEGIMLPADITLLTGSDFDVDKLYIMRRAIENRKNTGKFISDELADMQLEAGADFLDNEDLHINRELIADALNTTRDKALGGTRLWDKVHRDYDDFRERIETSFTTNVRSPREARNNRIIDLMWAVLTSPMVADQSFSPGNFDEPKRVGYLIAAHEVTGTPVSELSKLSTDELKTKYYKKASLLFAQTQVHFHKQNSVAGKLIGVFAQANVSHGFVTLMNNPTIKIRDKFILNGQTYQGRVPIDQILSKDNTTRVSEMLASMLASSVDAVKDPVLNLFNINMTTVNSAVAMMRLGIDIETIGWFLTTPIIKALVEKYDRENISEDKPLYRCIEEMKEVINSRHDNKIKYSPNWKMSRNDFIAWHENPTGPLTNDYYDNVEADYAEADDEYLADEKTDAINFQLLSLMEIMEDAANSFRNITHMTRYNSIASAVGPFVANTYVNKFGDKSFLENDDIGEFVNKEKVPPVIDLSTGNLFYENAFKRQILSNPILSAFRDSSYSLEKALLGENFAQAGPFGEMVFNKYQEDFGRLDDATAQKLSEFMMSYLAVSTPVFDLSDGEDIHKSRRAVILESLPAEVAEARSKMPNNRLLQVIRNQTDYSGKNFLVINTKGRDATDLQDIRAGWLQLYRDEAAAGKDILNNLAIRLVEYNFFRGGFGFSPKTFMRVLPSEIKKVLPNYITNISRNYIASPEAADNLIEQFLINNGIVSSNVVMSSISKENLNDDEIHTVTARGLRRGIAKIRFTDDPHSDYFYAVVRPIQVLDERGKVKKAFTIQSVEKLGGFNNEGFEIDPSRRVESIKSIYTMDNGESASGSQTKTSARPRQKAVPSTVRSKNDFTQALFAMMSEEEKDFIRNTNNMAKEVGFAKRWEFFLNFANKQEISDASDEFKVILNVLNSVNIGNITEEMLNELLDQHNICR